MYSENTNKNPEPSGTPCPNCHEEKPADHARCPHCNNRYCVQCGHPLEEMQSYCRLCGWRDKEWKYVPPAGSKPGLSSSNTPSNTPAPPPQLKTNPEPIDYRHIEAPVGIEISKHREYFREEMGAGRDKFKIKMPDFKKFLKPAPKRDKR
jgi:hypothetical protein